MSEFLISKISSRICDRGTKGCVITHKTYTQSELDAKVKAACERQRDICAGVYKKLYYDIKKYNSATTMYESIKFAPLADKEEG